MRYRLGDSHKKGDEHLSSHQDFSGVRVTRSLVLWVCFLDRCLSLCTFFFTIVLSVLLRCTDLLITPLVSFKLFWIRAQTRFWDNRRRASQKIGKPTKLREKKLAGGEGADKTKELKQDSQYRIRSPVKQGHCRV